MTTTVKIGVRAWTLAGIHQVEITIISTVVINVLRIFAARGSSSDESLSTAGELSELLETATAVNKTQDNNGH